MFSGEGESPKSFPTQIKMGFSTPTKISAWTAVSYSHNNWCGGTKGVIEALDPITGSTTAPVLENRGASCRDKKAVRSRSQRPESARSVICPTSLCVAIPRGFGGALQPSVLSLTYRHMAHRPNEKCSPEIPRGSVILSHGWNKCFFFRSSGCFPYFLLCCTYGCF